MFKSIANRLRYTYALLAILPLMVVGIILTTLSFFIQLEQASHIQQELAQRVGAQVEGFISNLENELFVIGESANLVDLPVEQQESMLARLRANQSAFVDLYLLDVDGNELIHQSYLAVSDVEQNRAWQQEDAYQQPLQTQQTYFSPVLIDSRNDPQMTIALPLVDNRTGQTEGVLVGKVRFKEIWELIEMVDVGEGESIYILSSEGTVVAHRNPSTVLQGRMYDLPDGRIGPGLDVETAVVSAQSLNFGDQTLTIVAEKSLSRALALAINTLLIIIAVTIGTLILALLLSFIATRHILNPIQALTNLATAIRKGDLSQRAKPGGLVELDELAITFNQMSGRLEEVLEGLEQEVAQRTQALHNSAKVSRYLSTILEQEKLLAQVVERLQTDFGFSHANVYLLNGNGQLHQAQQDSQTVRDESEQRIAQAVINKQAHHLVSRQNPGFGHGFFTQLTTPIVKGAEPIGALNVYKADDDSVDQQDVDLVQSIANQLGIALRNAESFAQLVEEKLDEVKRKEAAERQLEAYQNSALGRAERLALQLVENETAAFLTLHEVAQGASQDVQRKQVLENLPQALAKVATEHEQVQEAPIFLLQNLAEGFEFLVSGKETLELLPVGLRALTYNLSLDEMQEWHGSGDAHLLYRWCLEAAGVETMEHLAALSFETLETVKTEAFLSIVEGVVKLEPIQKMSDVYLRVQEARDKIAYLVTAVDQLRKVERGLRLTLSNLDHAIIERISEQWLTVLTTAMSNLQTQARLRCTLITRHTWFYDTITLTLAIRNNGRGVALNIRIETNESNHYTILDGEKRIKQLTPGEEKQVVVRLRPDALEGSEQFRVVFHIQYVDSRGTDQIEHFADIVHLMKAEGSFQFITNPYIVGTPLHAGSALFYGRDALVKSIQEDLTAVRRHNLVLIGQRRMGKTSLLKQLQTRLDETLIPVYLDGQAMALDPGMAGFFLNMATEIVFALEDRGVPLTLPQIEQFEKNPAMSFERTFLEEVLTHINGRHLLILFDEFEELENAVRRGNLEQTVFSFLRHLMQHYDHLSFIFCGTHRLEELAADYWSVLFNISLYHHVGSLTQEEAYQLIQDPVAEYGLRYDDLSLEKIWRLTSGHPYFLQLLCHSLVNQHNRLEKSYMTIADINTAVDEILASGEAHFIYLWNESSPHEKLTLFAISRLTPLTGRVTPIEVRDYWIERGKSVEIRDCRQALHQLQLREILVAENSFEVEEDSYYRWQLGLLGLWVEKYKSSSRVWDEVTL